MEVKSLPVKFPEIKKSITDLISDEEGSIPRHKLVTIGSTLLLMGLILGFDSAAAHESHVSHSSHASHGSHGSHSSTSYHKSHVSHTSHASHYNDHGSHYNEHSSHSSHSNAGGASGNDASSSGSSAPKFNTGGGHMNSGNVDLPGTEEVLVPEIPNDNNFQAEVPEVAPGALTNLNPGITADPKLNEK